MPSGFLNLALGLAIQIGSPGPSEQPNAPVPSRAFGQYGFEGSSEQRHPFDSQMSWVHGYHQEIPAYGGHPVYRPYNYKDVLSQSQTAAGWGERPALPYAHQFWHKYQDQSTMTRVTRANSVPAPYIFAQHVAPQPAAWVPQSRHLQFPNQQNLWQQSGQLAAPGSMAIPANLSETIQGPSLQPMGDLNQINYNRR